MLNFQLFLGKAGNGGAIQGSGQKWDFGTPCNGGGFGETAFGGGSAQCDGRSLYQHWRLSTGVWGKGCFDKNPYVAVPNFNKGSIEVLPSLEHGVTYEVFISHIPEMDPGQDVQLCVQAVSTLIKIFVEMSHQLRIGLKIVIFVPLQKIYFLIYNKTTCFF